MPRNMSFMLTTEQFKARTKTVTRRLGWKFASPGDILNGCEKCQGLKKGQRIVKLGQIRILDTIWEPLGSITDEDVVREGFPEWTREDFIAFFCGHNKCTPGTLVNRIEFEYIDEDADIQRENSAKGE